MSELSANWLRGYYQVGTWLEEAQSTIAEQPDTLAYFFDGVLCKEREVDDDTMRRWKLRFAALVKQLQALDKDTSAVELLTFFDLVN